MADETHPDPPPPPPPPALTDTPRKPWVKPTVRVIGETVDDIQSSIDPAFREIGLNSYAPES